MEFSPVWFLVWFWFWFWLLTQWILCVGYVWSYIHLDYSRMFLIEYDYTKNLPYRYLDACIVKPQYSVIIVLICFTNDLFSAAFSDINLLRESSSGNF